MKLVKKLICGRLGKDFSHHSHLRKQEYFFGLIYWFVFNKPLSLYCRNTNIDATSPLESSLLVSAQ